MVFIDRIDVLGQAVFDILNTNKVSLGLVDIWYGDQNIIPSTPSACVETGAKRREYDGAPRRFAIFFEVYIMLYNERIQDLQQNRKEAETLAEEIEAVLHGDSTLGGLVMDSFISSSEPGYVSRNKALVSAVRLTLTATSQRMLPSIYNPTP